jgi:hypothetical protein
MVPLQITLCNQTMTALPGAPFSACANDNCSLPSRCLPDSPRQIPGKHLYGKWTSARCIRYLSANRAIGLYTFLLNEPNAVIFLQVIPISNRGLSAARGPYI